MTNIIHQDIMIDTPHAILFDLDGTLADTAYDLAGAINYMRQIRNLESMDIENLRNYASQGTRGLLYAGFNLTPEHLDFSKYQKEFLATYLDKICHSTVLFDGVIPLINNLQEKNIAWGIVTNKSTNLTFPLLQELYKKYNFPQTQVIVCGDTTAYSKPHPQPIIYACELLNLPLDKHIWYVGDDIRDIKAAKAAKITSIVAQYGYLGEEQDTKKWQADYTIHTPLELLNLINKV